MVCQRRTNDDKTPRRIRRGITRSNVNGVRARGKFPSRSFLVAVEVPDVDTAKFDAAYNPALKVYQYALANPLHYNTLVNSRRDMNRSRKSVCDGAFDTPQHIKSPTVKKEVAKRKFCIVNRRGC